MKYCLCFFLIVNVTFSQYNIIIKSEILLDNNSKDKNYLFSGIQDIKSDSKGDVYILFEREKEIKRYDKYFKFKNKIGMLGSGPEEIKENIGFAITQNQEIIVVDPINYKLVIYDKNGKYIKYKKTNPYFWPVGIYDIGENLIVQNMSFENNKLLSIYNKNLIKITDFVNKEEFIKNDDDMIQSTIAPYPAKVLVTRKNNIIICSRVFQDFILKCDYDNLNKTIQIGIPKTKIPSYEIINRENFYSGNDQPKISYTSKKNNKRNYALLNNEVLFLVESGDYILQFINAKKTENRFKIIVNIFDKECKYLGTEEIKEYAKGKSIDFITKVFNTNEKDVFLAEVLDDYVPILKKIKIEVTKK